MSRTYLIFSLPDLVTNSFLHPICIYLRTQEITHTLTQAFLVGTSSTSPSTTFSS
ncbi:hypothetical protein AHAS_Ahas01G0272800 [Arachis hypogaea]